MRAALTINTWGDGAVYVVQLGERAFGRHVGKDVRDAGGRVFVRAGA